MTKLRLCLQETRHEILAGYTCPVLGDEFIQAGFIPLSIENDHVIAVSTLQRRSGEPPHNDPFDRVLIAQAKTENMILLTHDSLLGGYSESCVTEI